MCAPKYNDLHLDIRIAVALNSFNSGLKTHLFQIHYADLLIIVVYLELQSADERLLLRNLRSINFCFNNNN